MRVIKVYLYNLPEPLEFKDVSTSTSVFPYNTYLKIWKEDETTEIPLQNIIKFTEEYIEDEESEKEELKTSLEFSHPLSKWRFIDLETEEVWEYDMGKNLQHIDDIWYERYKQS